MEPIAAFKSQAFLPADLNRLERETGMLLATVDSLSVDELSRPSLCTGWSLAHVVAHLAQNADGLARMVDWAVTGREQQMYASREARAAAIDEWAAKPRAELIAELHAACDRFATAAAGMRGGLAVETLQMRPGPVNAWALPAMRITEVLVHHLDLRTVWELHEADMDALEDAMDITVGRIRGREGQPDLTLITDEGEEHVLGHGGVALRGGRDALLGWLARGLTEGVRCDGEMPRRPEDLMG